MFFVRPASSKKCTKPLLSWVSTRHIPHCICSGGQTGADRGALDWATQHGVKHGGYCPRGRLAEDGIIPPQYQLIETHSSRYPRRTEANVKASDATLIFIESKMGRGSCLTQKLCIKHNKPHLVVSDSTPIQTVREFLNTYKPRVLNVAGCRASAAPTIHARVKQVLSAVFENQPPTVGQHPQKEQNT